MSTLLAAACAVAVASARAEDRAAPTSETVVAGRALRASDSTPVSGARVAAFDQTTTTDNAGRFEVRLPAGRWTVSVEADGYLTTRRDVIVGTDRSAELTILLEPLRRFRERVDVVAQAEAASAAPAAIPVRPAEVVTVAGGAENVFRVLQTLPGVFATDDIGSRLSVRGGGPDQNLTIMDGVEIHNPYRLFGLASAFNPETIERFELTAGAFSARYGDRLSSLLVVDTRAGSSERWLTGSAALSLTDTNAIVEGRLPGGRGSWLLSGRRTYYDVVAERFTDSDLPSFGDVQGKVVLGLGGGRTLSLFALTSRERADATFDMEAEATKGAFFNRTRNDLLTATFQTTLGRRGWLRAIGAFYENTDVFDVGASFRDETRRSNARDKSGFDITDMDVDFSDVVRDRSLRHEVGLSLGRGHFVESGFELHRLRTRIGFTVSGAHTETEVRGSSLEGRSNVPDALTSGREDARWGAWLLDRWQFRNKLTIEGGLRVDRASINGRRYLSPRLAATYALTPVMRLRAGLGLHRQSPGYEKLWQADYLMDLTGDGKLPLQSAHARHALLTLERDIGPGTLARVEAYYKTFDQLIIGRLETPAETAERLARYDFPDDLTPEIPSHAWVTRFPTNDGRGRAWGFDVYVTRRATTPTTRLTGWASYTYGSADSKAYGLTYPFDYDRRHALSVVADLRLSSRFNLALTGRLASGFPCTSPVGVRVAAQEDALDRDGDGNTYELIPARDSAGLLMFTPYYGDLTHLNRDRLPYYARLDARLTFTPNWGRGRVKFYLDAINVFNRRNASIIETTLEHDPSSDRPRLVNTRQAALPFLPSLGVHVNFATPKWKPTPRHTKTDCGPAGEPCVAAPQRPGRFAVGLRLVGTQGMGVDLAHAVSSRLGVRIGLGLPTTLALEERIGGTTYDVKARLGTQTALVDLYPFSGRLRLSAGLSASRHRFDVRAQEAATYDIDGVTHAAGEVGVIAGEARVRRVAPYVGLGWGPTVRHRRRLGWVFDVGAVLQGAPRAELHASGPLATDSAFQHSLERETGVLASRLRGWRVFPIVGVSLSYRLR